MVRKESVPAPDALAWLDPSVAWQNCRKPRQPVDSTHGRQVESGDVGSVERGGLSPCRSNKDGNGEFEAPQDGNTSPESGQDPGKAATQRPTGKHLRAIAAMVTQIMVLLALAATVFGALVYDSRLYHGVDVFGRSIYGESPFVPKDVPKPLSISSPTAVDEGVCFESYVPDNAGSEDKRNAERCLASDRESDDVALGHGGSQWVTWF